MSATLQAGLFGEYFTPKGEVQFLPRLVLFFMHASVTSVQEPRIVLQHARTGMALVPARNLGCDTD
jgi:hypothetical protein